MKAIITPVFWLCLAVLLLSAIGPAQKPALPAPNNTLAASKVSLREFLSLGTACYTWTEYTGDTPKPHQGRLVFVLQDELVYSLAWFSNARYTRPWPVVSGLGVLQGERLLLVYRNAAGDYDRAYYNTSCVFEFDPITRAFTCAFTQQAQPDGERSPGMARGTLVAAPGKEFADYIQAAELRAGMGEDRTRGSHHCAVLPHNEAKAEYQTEYKGQTYLFCCPSCLEVFKARPEMFERQNMESMFNP